ncbi:MAG: glycine cleavage system protein H [Deltaproteobacteria bacterium RIFCSPHIGHO2_12_FULL_43_9]|nr:MAG: glycine cleavage system protein H [Deltaproteobacteria bacterium RIFCSPHIGHO2_12_FULL_43_9]
MSYEIPDDLFYTKEHEWARREGDFVVVGISAYAQESLGDIVFIELPKIGEELSQNDTFGVVESVKAVSDLFSPISGKVVETNGTVTETPELINQDPYGEGWLIKLTMGDDSELHNLMNATEYEEYLGQEAKEATEP